MWDRMQLVATPSFGGQVPPSVPHGHIASQFAPAPAAAADAA